MQSRGLRTALYIALLVAVTAVLAHTQTFTLLYSFTNGADGGQPFAGLVGDSKGNLYGTTINGGAHYGGTVFELDKRGKESVLHNFAGSDGSNPYAGLVRDAIGNLYGATYYSYTGYGEVFELIHSTIPWRMTVLHNFTGGTDSAHPYFENLALDAAGNIYGTTAGGTDYGTVFKVDKAGSKTLLYSFLGGSDGWAPEAGLVMDAAGDLYGTTRMGGHPELQYCCGTVFKVTKNGKETVLYRFLPDLGDGAYPASALVRDATGNLYGTTEGGGSFGYGTVFKLDGTGTETVLHSFGGADGRQPQAGVARDAAGNLYGTTVFGGDFSQCSSLGCGTIFKLDPGGNEAVLHVFEESDGAFPSGQLILDKAGNLYGTTSNGGPSGGGTIFKISLDSPSSVPISRVKPGIDGRLSAVR